MLIIFIKLLAYSKYAESESIRKVLYAVDAGIFGLLIHATASLFASGVGAMVLPYGVFLFTIFALHVGVMKKVYNNLNNV